MFTFPKSEYKWCPQCGGNIRMEAEYCRFCRKAIENRLLKTRVAHAAITIDEVAKWLPSFNTLVTRVSDQLQSRFEQADIDFPMISIGLPEGTTPAEFKRQRREDTTCPHKLPDPHVAGLIQDILLCLLESGESIVEICEYPHLKLLELTPQEVAAEAELRKDESKRNNRCRYCAESIFPDDEECRFCGGSGDKRPEKAVSAVFDKTIDQALLKDVLLYEAVWRTIHGVTPLSAEVLESNGISAENIEREILRQRSSDLGPMPRFCRRMADLNLTSHWTPESLSITKIVDLGSALDFERETDRSEEAMIVYQHALRRTDNREDLMAERSNALRFIACWHQRKGDYEQERKYSEMSTECKTYGMSDDLKALMQKSDLQMKKLLADGPMSDKDPEKRLDRLDKMLSDSKDSMSEMISIMNAAIPGLGEAMAGIGASVNVQMQVSRLIIEGEVAQNKGDLKIAEERYQEALSLRDDSWMSNKCMILCSLAKVKHLQGNDQKAEALLNDAIQEADELNEAMPEIGKSTIWACRLALACFLRDTGRYDQSYEQFTYALKVQQEYIDESLKQYGGSKEQYSPGAAHLKEEYARLLRALNRTEEAEKLELEVVQLKKESEECANKQKEKREKYKQELERRERQSE